MNLIFLVLSLIILYIAIVWLWFKYSKRLNQKFIETRVKLNKHSKLFVVKYQPESEISTDILRRMYLLMISLNEDARKTGNCVVFDYPVNYPRNFYTSSTILSKLVDTMSQFMLINIKNSTVIVKFLLINYQHRQARFNISVWTQTNFLKQTGNIEAIRTSLNPKSRIHLNIAEHIAHENNSYLRFETQDGLKISTDIKLNIADVKNTVVRQLDIKNPAKFHILIADDNKYSFQMLRNNLLYLGFDVKPTSDWQSAKRHIEDMMFVPNVIFISDTLLNEVNFDKLESHILYKNIAIVIIRKHGTKNVKDAKIYAQYITQPFLHETLINILNNCKKHCQNGGGG
ncbi:MAG: hypothetical protein ACTTJC_00460 [Campylobacter sp.]